MTRRLTHAFCAVVVGLLALGAVAQADVRVGPNYRLNSDSGPFRGKDQVAIAVDPDNGNHVVEVNANYLTENCEATTSFDGGVTWSDAVVLQPPDPGLGQPFTQSCRISNHLGETMFQTVVFGSGDNVYTTSIVPRTGTTYPEQAAGTIVYKSTDGGQTWNKGVEAMAGGPGNPAGGSLTPAMGPYYELPTVAVDPGAGTGGADRVIVAAHETTGNANSPTPCGGANPPCNPSVRTAVSNDSGDTFGLPVRASAASVAIAGPDSASQPVVNPDHSINIAWRTLGATGLIQVARSTDGGQSWGAPVDVVGVTAGGLSSSSHVTPLQSTGSSFPRLAGKDGKLYIVYNQGTPGTTPPAGGFQGSDHFINADSHVYFQRSLDMGATWSVPKLIDDTTQHPGALIVQTRHPDVDVAPDGRIDIVWEDRRHWYQGPGEHDCVHTHVLCDDARLGDTYYAYSSDGGTTFSKDRRISDRSHNNDVGYDYRFGTGWAFGPQTAVLGDGKLLIAWMDSREGNFENDNQDIYLAKVDFNASGGAPQSNIDKPDPVSLAVALSQHAYPGGGESLLASTFATRNGTNPVIVNQDDKAGALAASVLARANLSPLLLSPAAGLPDAVKAEVARLTPGGAVLVGDTSQLSDQVATDAQNAPASPLDPATVKRISGQSGADTAANIAYAMDRRTAAEKTANTPAFDAAVIVNPSSPDAGAAAGLAAARRLPILFVGSTSVPQQTSDALSNLDIAKTLVIGNSDVISDAVANTLPSPTRLGGADQYETSKAVNAEAIDRGMPTNVAYVVDGTHTLDAALVGAAVGRTTALMVLAKAPLYSNAAAAVSGQGLTRVDKVVFVGPQAPPPVETPTATPTASATPTVTAVPTTTPTPTPSKCGKPKLVRRNVSKSRKRTDTRIRLACAGAVKATASTKIKVKRKKRTLKLKTKVKSLSGLNRAIRISLPKKARRELARAHKLVITIVVRFTPKTRSAYALPSRVTIKVTVKQPRKKK